MELAPEEIDGLIKWSLIRAARQAEREFTEKLATHGLSPVQFGVLCHLATGEPFTQAQLARAVLTRPQSVSGVVDGLVERGLISREGNRARGRRNPLTLTEPGHALLEQAWPAVQTMNRPEQLGLSKGEAQMLNDLLLRMAHPAMP
jgi:DNA-binding MarR family transcriptional regulator